MKKNNNLPHLLLAIDPGASAIKVVASLAGDSKCLPFTIDTDWVDLDELHESERIPESNLNFNENSIWVGFGDKKYAIGNLARIRYNTYFSIKPLKNDSIIPKILAAIAVAHKKFDLPPKFNISISSVLPPGEFLYTEDVTDKLLVALRSFQTPGGTIKPVVQLLTIKPEGYGILNWHRIYGAATTRDVGVIMFGYRNTSALFSVSGQLTNLESSDFGFYHVLDRISKTSGGSYDCQALAKPVWNYLIYNDESGFRSLYKSVTNRELELSMIKKAISQSMVEYHKILQNWLLSSMQKTGAIVLCGGNADYIGTSFDDFLKNYTECICDPGDLILRHIPDIDIPDEIKDTNMEVRYLDIYCLWLELSHKYNASTP
jgi:hypothetical protein